MKTIRLTTAQALVKFLDQQYIEIDDQQHKFVHGVFGIFGHGNVTGIGEALEYQQHDLKYIRGSNEQGMVHSATAFAKQNNRLSIYAVTSSIGPGATNMITGAATATINRIPVLLLPGDIFACRQPDPVLQQLEHPMNYTITVNDCFRPVSKYWDCIMRPEQLITALLNAFRVLTDPVATGAVTLSLPQDVQCEMYDYPESFFRKRVHIIERRAPSKQSIDNAVQLITNAKQPLIIAGGGVHYARAAHSLVQFAERTAIPVAETQAGKSVIAWDHAMSVGGVGVTGTLAANRLAKEADLIIAIGSRLADFSTASKSAFAHKNVKFISINVNIDDGLKMDSDCICADAKFALNMLDQYLVEAKYQTSTAYQEKIKTLRDQWNQEVDRVYKIQVNASGDLAQTAVVGTLNNALEESDVIICAAGSLPGDLHRLWRSTQPNTYHMEYGYSCMGYEVAGALGIKMALQQQHNNAEVYCLCGDGSFLMMHSELVTSLTEKQKINIILFNSRGFNSIRSLQTSLGSQGYGTDLCYRKQPKGAANGELFDIDFAAYGKALGAQTYIAHSLAELTDCLRKAKQSDISTLIEVKVAIGTQSANYESWWRVGVAETSTSQLVKSAHRDMARKVKETLNG